MIPVQYQFVGKNGSGRRPLGLLVLAQLPLLVVRPLRDGWHSPDLWILLACLAAFALLFRRRASGMVCWSPVCGTLLVADAALLTAALLLRSPLLAACGAICSLAALGAASADVVADRHLGSLSLLFLLAITPPTRIAEPCSRLVSNSVTNTASWLAWNRDIAHYRENNTLTSITTSVDVHDVLWNPASLQAVMAIAVVSGVLLRRSVIQTAALAVSIAPVFLLLKSWETLWLLKLQPGTFLGSPLRMSLCTLPLYLPAIASADAFVRVLTSPIPAVLRQGEAAAWDNPVTIAWNTLVAGMAEVPLKVFRASELQLSRFTVFFCCWLLPIASGLALFVFVAGGRS